VYFQFELVEEVRRAAATTTLTGQSSRRPKYTIAGVMNKNAVILEAQGSSHKGNV